MQRNLIINEYLKPPNVYENTEDRNVKYSQAQQDETIYKILPIQGGIFVEIGAFNGKVLSNTLWLERKHKWTGLLIEANPDLCIEIDKVKRFAWRLCSCIANQMSDHFVKASVLGGLAKTLNKRIATDFNSRDHVKVPCFTLNDVRNIIGYHTIDYFSLDVEGAEINILELMKEDLRHRYIVVNIWTIEYRIHDGHRNIIHESKEKLEQIRLFFKDIGGYEEHSQLGSSDGVDGYALDVVFVRKDIVHTQ